MKIFIVWNTQTSIIMTKIQHIGNIGKKPWKENINMRKLFAFIFILISYSLVVLKIVMAIGIFNNDLTFTSKFFMSPLSSIFIILFLIGHPIKTVTYLTIALLILLLVSWIMVIISLFMGLKSKKARKKLFIFSIVIAIYDLIILSGLTWVAYIDNEIVHLDRDILWGIILAICVIIVNTICLILTSKGTNKRKAKT